MAELSTKRHSLSHIMSQAIAATFPDLTILRGVGPAIDNGFYQDYDFGDFSLTEEHLKDIEKKMKHILKQNQLFVQSFLTLDEAKAKFAGDPYKIELIEDLARDGETQFGVYTNTLQNGTLTYDDLCAGPHVEKTSELDENSFKLDRIAGAYWRGDEKNKMLTRVYGVAFDTKEELDAYVKQQEEAKKRDHRILGAKLNLFTVSPLVGSGLPMLKPNGMIIRKEIEDYIWSLHKHHGYLRVWTPHIAKIDLYEASGHAAKFGNELFRVKGGHGEDFCMKPMNCPHHMQIFADNQWSYRDMPIRYFEPATVYRDEKPGQLSGLTRVRAITQDDGHLFLRVAQIKQEVGIIVSIIKEFYTTLGMVDDYWVSLSVSDPATPEKYLGTRQIWETAESSLEEAAKQFELPYKRIEGEAAFYGPKLDFMFKDAIGRQWQLATIQLDFNLPERFDLSYINEAGEKERPVVIHRAISGSLERFMGVMIEHFAGSFPLWLAPRQVIVVPVGEKFNDYAEKVLASLKAADIRAEIDLSTDGLNKKIRNAEQSRINYILVVGEKEEATSGVAVRNYKTKEQTEISLDEVIKNLASEITTKSL
ncbi:MAG: threonine--tRNA ligase [Candidatus Gracilibacteria bacterium]